MNYPKAEAIICLKQLDLEDLRSLRKENDIGERHKYASCGACFYDLLLICLVTFIDSFAL